ncbi:dTDP-4-dehydrorhamnose 3,5-epimerase family protein [Saccharolobus islandicus]|nr:dTDP-4-dehydrorhamnose 3,5-epimerase family protein [Sulfolobus islandicus]
MLRIPLGFTHGFQVIEELIVMRFMIHNEYSPPHEKWINYS